MVQGRPFVRRPVCSTLAGFMFRFQKDAGIAGNASADWGCTYGTAFERPPVLCGDADDAFDEGNPGSGLRFGRIPAATMERNNIAHDDS